MIEPIGYDSYYQDERMKVLKTNTPTSIRNIPCDTCKFKSVCEEYEVECSAFRYWSQHGNYDDNMIAKHVRKI